MIFLEVCIDSITSAKNAYDAGAHRLEVCSSLSEGGLTPSYGLVVSIKKTMKVPIYCMIRPRAGDFKYSEREVQQMLEDITILKPHCDGFVFGALTADNEVDVTVCLHLIEAAKPLPCTFHRAFDMTKDKLKSLKDIVTLGFQNVLTSGGERTAPHGSSVIRLLVEKFGSDITFVAGSGVTASNVKELLDNCKVHWIHASGRKAQGFSQDGNLTEFSQHYVADCNTIMALLEALKTIDHVDD